MQLISIKIGLLSVLLLKTCVRKKGGVGGFAPQTLTQSYYFEPPLSKKRSRATATVAKFALINQSRLFRARLLTNLNTHQKRSQGGGEARGPPPPIKICLITKRPSTAEKTQQPLLRLGWLVCLVATL